MATQTDRLGMKHPEETVRIARQEGEDNLRNKVLTHLQEKYIGPDAPPRGTTEAKAILTLAKELAQFMRDELGR